MKEKNLVDTLFRQLGELQERVNPTATPVSFGAFAGRPADFATQILGVRLLGWQRRFLDAFHARAQHCVRSANGCGKTHLAPVLLLYIAVVLKGTGIYFSATEKQTRAQLVTGLRRLIEGAPRLSADVYLHGCTFRDGGAIILTAASDMSSMQGHHDGAMVIVADEAQALEEEQLQALQGNVVGADNWLVMLGNPLVMGGPFAKVAQSGDDTWSRTKVTAYDVINDPEAAGMKGLITLEGVNRIRQSWGQESSVFGSRVLAEFPRTPEDAMFSPDLIAEAFRKHRTGELLDSVQQKTRVLGIDVAASADGDETVIASARGGHVEEITSWHEADTMRTVSRVEEYLRKRGVPRKPPAGAGQVHPLWGQSMPGDPLEFVGKPAVLRVDEIGVGRGVADRLKEKGYPCQPFNASKRPETSEDAMTRFQNRRAEAFDRFRTKLVKGKIALPYDPQLEEELQTCRAFTNAMGRLQIIDKGDWKLVLGRSPDRLDAVVIAVAGSGAVTFEAMNRIPARGIAL